MRGKLVCGTENVGAGRSLGAPHAAQPSPGLCTPLRGAAVRRHRYALFSCAREWHGGRLLVIFTGPSNTPGPDEAQQLPTLLSPAALASDPVSWATGGGQALATRA